MSTLTAEDTRKVAQRRDWVSMPHGLQPVWRNKVRIFAGVDMESAEQSQDKFIAVRDAVAQNITMMIDFPSATERGSATYDIFSPTDDLYQLWREIKDAQDIADLSALISGLYTWTFANRVLIEPAS